MSLWLTRRCGSQLGAGPKFLWAPHPLVILQSPGTSNFDRAPKSSFHGPPKSFNPKTPLRNQQPQQKHKDIALGVGKPGAQGYQWVDGPGVLRLHVSANETSWSGSCLRDSFGGSGTVGASAVTNVLVPCS